VRPHVAVVHERHHVAGGGAQRRARLQRGVLVAQVLAAADRVFHHRWHAAPLHRGDLHRGTHHHEGAGRNEQARGRSEPPGLALPHLRAEVGSGRQVDADLRETEALQREAVRGREVHRVLREVCSLRALDANALELVQSLHVHAELLREELPEARDLQRGADAEHLLDRRVAVEGLVVAARAADLLHELLEHALHSGHELARVLVRRGLLLEALGPRIVHAALAERVDDRLGEVRSAQRESADPAAAALRHDDVAGARADVDDGQRRSAVRELEVVAHGVKER